MRHIFLGSGKDFTALRPFRARACKLLHYLYQRNGVWVAGSSLSPWGPERVYTGGVGVMQYAIRAEDLGAVALGQASRAWHNAGLHREEI